MYLPVASRQVGRYRVPYNPKVNLQGWPEWRGGGQRVLADVPVRATMQRMHDCSSRGTIHDGSLPGAEAKRKIRGPFHLLANTRPWGSGCCRVLLLVTQHFWPTTTTTTATLFSLLLERGRIHFFGSFFASSSIKSKRDHHVRCNAAMVPPQQDAHRRGPGRRWRRLRRYPVRLEQAQRCSRAAEQ